MRDWLRAWVIRPLLVVSLALWVLAVVMFAPLLRLLEDEGDA